MISPTTEHCCEQMTTQLNRQCDRHPDTSDCVDVLVRFSPRFQEYGIVIHDGGSAKCRIEFCPWCGHRLPESQRDRWFDELERRGIDPWEDGVPAEFEDGRWLTSAPGQL
ncbi:DUF6980 family protein [Streptomyces sp. NRRL WC-3742]|uniref:DUF6980 family protein n=1 Tax=Streptomyces sp. NRRL WC-3742 TaxID=1463934 RepID=UPI000A93AC9D|nr:hypothetical protein [Streptomyces sp. NRRL WC-3742]